MGMEVGEYMCVCDQHWAYCYHHKVLSVQICSNYSKSRRVYLGMCFDSVGVLWTVTVSLLANYHGKLMGQVTAGSLKETGDWTYADDAGRWHSPARILERYGLHDMALCVTQVRSQCREILSCLVVVNINPCTILYAWVLLSEGLYVFIKEHWIKH